MAEAYGESVLSSSSLPNALKDFLNVAKPEDFMSTDPSVSPRAAIFLSEYAPFEIDTAMRISAVRLGVAIQYETLIRATKMILDDATMDRRFSKDNIRGSLLVRCASMHTSISIVNRSPAL